MKGLEEREREREENSREIITIINTRHQTVER
jgi:hypothetical protein